MTTFLTSDHQLKSFNNFEFLMPIKISQAQLLKLPKKDQRAFAAYLLRNISVSTPTWVEWYTRAYVQKTLNSGKKTLHYKSSPKYVNTLFLNMRARSTISVSLIWFTMLSCCSCFFPFWDNLLATSIVKPAISLLVVKPCKTVAEYEGLDTSLLSNISVSRIRNVLTKNGQNELKKIKT